MTVTFDSLAAGADANSAGLSYDDYAAVLKTYVDDTGMINYNGLKANSEKLESFVTAMGKVDPNSYSKWSKKEQIAFWLNAYNGFTLKVIIDNYPIKPSFLRSRIYPKNSIRQIPGVWDKIKFDVMARKLTLGHIEHEIIRKKFDEPRIHMAMVCAAMGCPPLLNKPYTGQKLDAQLDERTRRFLGNQAKFKVDRKNNRLYLSPIFKWFADDFVKKYAPKKNVAQHGKETSAVLNFIAAYLKQVQRDYILRGQFKIKYLSYDWSLNEQEATNNRKAQKDK
jgi:hypothetical protein